jgi:DNA-binding winged helix-turn-helix (wHTH) protein/TolB-like protein/tetratricopeptide (TPR) repeat protein
MARDLYEFGPFRLDTTGRRLLRDGLPVSLTPKAFDALAVLVEGHGRRLSREELVSHIWPDTTVSEDNLKQCIAVLRNALEDNPRSPTYIATLPGYGYAFVAEVHTHSNGNNGNGSNGDASNGNGSGHAPEISSAGTSPSPSVNDPRVNPSKATSKRRLVPTVATALILTAAALITASPIRRKIFHQPRPNSVAVLPFQPLSAQSESEDEYLGLGLADAIITKLGSARSLHVRPIEEVSRYSGTVDPIKAGRDLAVGALLEGTIQRQGDKIRINARLLDTKNGTTLWSDEIDSSINDMFAIEDNVVAEVERVLVANPSPPLQKTSGGSAPAALALAHQDYMKGRFFWSKRTQQGITTAIGLFQQAIEQDPQYAEAYDGIADSYALLGFYGYLPPSESYPKAKAAALQALAINRDLPEPHVSLMIVATDYDWDWQTAETEFRAAIALKPNHAEAYQAHAYLLLALGRPDAAAREVEKALELDPLSPGFNMTLAWAHYLAHDYPRCLEQCRRTRELYPEFVVAVQVAALAHVQEKDWQQAGAELAESRKLSPGNPMTELLQAQILAAQDRTPAQQNEIRAQLKQFLHQSKPNVALSYYAAGAYASLGDNDEAFEALDQSYAARSNWLIYLKLDPRFDSLHKDPRFAALLKKVGLSLDQSQDQSQNNQPENNR